MGGKDETSPPPKKSLSEPTTAHIRFSLFILFSSEKDGSWLVR